MLYAVLIVIIAVLGFATKLIDFTDLSSMVTISAASLIKLLLMVAGVLLLENVIVLVLEAYKPKSHRAM